jgi:hypothetical protein
MALCSWFAVHSKFFREYGFAVRKNWRAKGEERDKESLTPPPPPKKKKRFEVFFHIYVIRNFELKVS